MSRGYLGYLLHHLPMLGVRIAEGLKIIALVDGKGDATSHFEALFREEFLRLLDRRIVHNQQVAMRLQIDLVHIQLTGDGRPRLTQPLLVLHLLNLRSTHIHRHLEVLVLGSHRRHHHQCHHPKPDSE